MANLANTSEGSKAPAQSPERPRYFCVVDWKKLQHYGDRRNPPWIKLYNFLLDDYRFARLQDASKAHTVGIWLLASRDGNRIPFDADWVGKRINSTERVDLEHLLSAGFIEICNDEASHASNVLAKPEQSAALDIDKEEDKDTEEENAPAAQACTVQTTASSATMPSISPNTLTRSGDEVKAKDVDPVATLPDGSPWMFPVKPKGKGVDAGKAEWPLRTSKLREYETLYPTIDVKATFRQALAWCRDHPPKRKTFGGMPGFLSRWLNKDLELNRNPKISTNGVSNGRIDPRKSREFPESIDITAAIAR